ncbi:Uncharacterised protein [Pantoea agglomerans]|uniref:Uncharacterized protein n=1 Tax=Enterobacter agglomerans TaxID=549 RepID=A0A379LSM9_ENTAG|nr:Uncharacterised protein [Pantoea agglomerans]
MQSLHDLLPNKEESDAIFSLPEGGDAAQWEARFARGWQAFSQGEQPALDPPQYFAVMEPLARTWH